MPLLALVSGILLLPLVSGLRAAPNFTVGRAGPYAPTPVQRHGRLGVMRSQIIDQAGNPVRLRGVSLSPTAQAAGFYTGKLVQWLVRDWKVTLVRAVITESAHLEDPELQTKKIQRVVKAATDAGIYVIIAWDDPRADQNLEEARVFFSYMAETYGRQWNVMFEPFNEPQEQNWTALKPYHSSIVSAIRMHSDNIIILGTPHSCRAVDEAVRDPILAWNLAYAVHSDPQTGNLELQQKMTAAMNAGIAVFNSQWAAVSSNLEKADRWVAFLAQHRISDCSLVSDQKDAFAGLRPGASTHGDWSQEDLTSSGNWVRASLRDAPSCDLCSATGENCLATGCCRSPGLTCYQRDEHYGTCLSTCQPGAHNDDADFHGSWRCWELGGECRAACAAAGEACQDTRCCMDKTMKCYQKNEVHSVCKSSCVPGLDPVDFDDTQEYWTCELNDISGLGGSGGSIHDSADMSAATGASSSTDASSSSTHDNSDTSTDTGASSGTGASGRMDRASGPEVFLFRNTGIGASEEPE